MDVAEGDLIRQVLAVLLVFGLLGVAVWKLRSGGFPARGGARRLDSVGRLVLTPQHAIHVLRIDGQELVVATHPQGCSILRDGPESPEGLGMKQLLFLLAVPAIAAPNDSLLGVTLVADKSGQSLGAPMQIILLLTLLTMLPAILMSATPFLRIVVVLHFLRQALGTQTTPSNQVLVGLALFLSLIVLQPVGTELIHQSWEPLEQGQITASQAWERASVPIHAFLLRFAREKDIALFMELSHAPAPKSPAEVPLSALAPAYVLSELKTAFQIGAVLFLPFLVIDLIVASVTLSIGMVQLPPVMVSAPFKILLFVLVDGWNLVIGSLVRSFH